jgi:hypothetical protein
LYDKATNARCRLMTVGLVNKRQSRMSLKKRVEVLLRDRAGQYPAWVRAPVGGHEYFTSLSRSKLYELEKSGLIRTASLREPGRQKGVKLFYLPSILQYIERHVVAANAEAVPVNGAEVGSTKES